MSRNWKHLIAAAVVWGFVIWCLSIGKSHAEVTQIPRVEFECKGLRGVVFNEDGTLEINNKSFRLEGGQGDMLFFDNKVTLRGELEGDQLMFDNTQIIYGGKAYRCNAV